MPSRFSLAAALPLALAAALAAGPVIAADPAVAPSPPNPAAAGPPAASALPPGNTVVARVDGVEFHLSDIEAAQRSLPQQAQKLPFEQVYPILLDRLVAGALVTRHGNIIGTAEQFGAVVIALALAAVMAAGLRMVTGRTRKAGR